MPPGPTERHNSLLLFGAALLLCLFTGVSPVAADKEAITAAITKINQFRTDYDRGIVTMDDRLTRAARRHAKAMADRDFFSHVGADGSRMGQRVTDAGYIWHLVAENIAAGMTDPSQAVESWIDSPGHRQNLLLKGAAHIGLAHVRIDPDPGSTNFKDYWVLLLAAPQ